MAPMRKAAGAGRGRYGLSRLRHRAILAAFRRVRFLVGENGHVQYARTVASTDPDIGAAPDSNDGRHAGGQGKAQALARAQIQETAARTARQSPATRRPTPG